MVSRKDRFSGCLIGQCLGDALGFVVEGYPPAVCRQYVEDVLRAGRAGECGRAPMPFGQYTDDSQLARELLQSLVARRGFDPEDYARRIASLFVEDRVVGRGLATEAAAFRLARGVPWAEAGAPAPSAGNGSAMRAAPVGLVYAKEPGRLVEVARDQGRITHQDPRCSAGAAAIAGAVALVLEGEPVAPQPFLSRLAAWAGEVEPSLAEHLRGLIEWVPLSPEEAAPRIARAGLPPDYRDPWQGISPFVVGSVLWSLYCFLRTPGDYWETICTSVAAGGDTDTTAAMAGAISGAHLGLAAIPGPLARRLTDRGSWGFEDLLRLAHAGCQLA